LKTVPIGADRDLIYGFSASAAYASWQAMATQEMIERIQQAPPGTLLVMPDGPMLNYLTRRESPVPYVAFVPPEALAFGAQAMTRALETHPADLLVLAHRDMTEFGAPTFDTEPLLGRQIIDWVRRHYVSVVTIGRDPLNPTRSGLELLSRAQGGTDP